MQTWVTVAGKHVASGITLGTMPAEESDGPSAGVTKAEPNRAEDGSLTRIRRRARGSSGQTPGPPGAGLARHPAEVAGR